RRKGGLVALSQIGDALRDSLRAFALRRKVERPAKRRRPPEQSVPAPPPRGRLGPWFLLWSFFLMATSWLHRLLKKSRPGRQKLWPNRFVPSLEALGDRIVPSAFHVTTLADSGPGSLRAAVAQANAHPGADAIVFESGLAGTIALTGGELDVTDDLKINGP